MGGEANGILRPDPQVKTGLPKISGGAVQIGIPHANIASVSTSALVANEVRYIPFYVRYAITITEMYFEVTTAPAGAANVRVGIYASDTNMQPTGAPVLDTTTAVAGAFTGVKSALALTATLTPGAYLMAINTDTIMTLRSFIGGAIFLSVGLGATAISQRYSIAQTYGAFPTPGTPWTTLNLSNGGLQYVAAFKWTE